MTETANMPAPMQHLATYPSRASGRAAQRKLESAGIPSILVDTGPAPYSEKENEMRLLVTPKLAPVAQKALGLTQPRKRAGAIASVILLFAALLLALHR